jgi:hypothetical protein
MKTILMFLILLLSSGCSFTNWDKRDKMLMGAVATLQTIDCIQTRQIVKEDDELNPLIYKEDVVIPYFIGTTYLYYLIADHFPKYRTGLLKTITGIQILNTGRNWYLDYKLRF